MKARSYNVYLARSEWNFSGLHTTTEKLLTTVHNMTPTAREVSVLIGCLLPGETIKTTDQSLYEQIHDSLDAGFFSVSLASPDMFVSRSVSFEEV